MQSENGAYAGEVTALLKIKVLQKLLHSDAIEEPFLVPQRTIQSMVL